MGIIVQKYGGSSLADIEKIKRVASRIVSAKKEGNQVVAIVSAMGKTTNKLIELAKDIHPNPPKREIDMLLSTGEQMSMSLLAMAIDFFGEKALSLTGAQAGIITNSSYSKAKIVDIVSDRLIKELKDDNIIIVAGFQGQDENQDITTLGRGGSDTTAVSIAAALKADLCEIFTDVDGVYACDPRIVPNIKKLKSVSYNEMLELAISGAKVLQSRSVEVAKTHGVVLHVRSSFNHNIGTVVKEEVSLIENDGLITGIAHDFDVVKVAIFGVPDKPGMAARIFKELATENINVQMIVQSAQIKNKNDIAFTCSSEEAEEVEAILKKIVKEKGAEKFTIAQDFAKVSIIGAGMSTHSNIASTMFETLAKEGINIDMISTSEITISVIINSKDCKNAVKKLAQAFELCE